jgi:hypothetical protein
MLTLINNRVIGRKGNVVLVDFSRPPPPPAPRFPGANGLREPSCEETRFEPPPARTGSKAASCGGRSRSTSELIST